NRGTCRSFDSTRRARSASVAYANIVWLAMLVASALAYICGLRSQVRMCSSSNIRASRFDPTMACSTCSAGGRNPAVIWWRRRLKPASALRWLSSAERLKSSRRSSCRWTPSRLAWPGHTSCRYARRSSTKWGKGSDGYMGSQEFGQNHNGTIMLRLMSGTLFVVATPIGNLEDITMRALRVLRDVAVIAAEDTRRTARLLAHYGIPTPTISFHEHNARSRTPQLLSRLRAGDSIAIVTDAGTPGLSD